MILDQKKVIESIDEEYKNELSKISKDLNIAIVISSENEGARLFERSILKLLDRLGIGSKIIKLSEDVEEAEFIDQIKELNNDPLVDGIIVLSPIAKKVRREVVNSLICPKKDIDGANPVNTGKMVSMDDTGLYPCIAEAVIELLDHYKIDLKGKNVTVINNSPTVGVPIANLLTQRFATVTICHVYTKDLKDKLLGSDIVISAAGVSGLIRDDMVKNDTILIDLAVTKDQDGKVTGDASIEALEKVNIHSSTTDSTGIGKITTYMLIKNLIKAQKIIEG